MRACNFEGKWNEIQCIGKRYNKNSQSYYLRQGDNVLSACLLATLLKDLRVDYDKTVKRGPGDKRNVIKFWWWPRSQAILGGGLHSTQKEWHVKIVIKVCPLMDVSHGCLEAWCSSNEDSQIWHNLGKDLRFLNALSSFPNLIVAWVKTQCSSDRFSTAR